MKRISLLFVSLVLALTFASCGSKKPVSARIILLENNQGVVALPGGEKDRKAAMKLISERCKKFTITKEVEETVGSVETQVGETKVEKGQSPEKKVIKEDKKELRIYFTCE